MVSVIFFFRNIGQKAGLAKRICQKKKNGCWFNLNNGDALGRMDMRNRSVGAENKIGRAAHAALPMNVNIVLGYMPNDFLTASIFLFASSSARSKSSRDASGQRTSM